MSSDSHLFRTAEELGALGATFEGWAWNAHGERHSRRTWLPLYEGKLLNHYDDRFSTYSGAQGQSLPRISDSSHQDPNSEPLPRYWVESSDVDRVLGARANQRWFFGYRWISASTNERTWVSSALPKAAVGNSLPIVFSSYPSRTIQLQAVWASIVADYVVRQKLSGSNMTFGFVSQIAVPHPKTFDLPPAWSREPLASFVTPNVLELTYTSYRIAPYAQDMGDTGEPFHWNPQRRTLIQAELDGAMMHVYGLRRDEVEHILDSFPGLRRNEERDHGEFRTRRLVLDYYDRMTTAAETGLPYQTPIDPPPGQGPRHAPRGSTNQ